ncbi:hypothetical protein SCA6_007689 [Theobroma cacao]
MRSTCLLSYFRLRIAYLDQDYVAKNLFAVITSFISLDPSFKHRLIYVTVSKRVNLRGLVIGDGLTDPITQFANYADNACYLVMVNERQKGELEEAQWEGAKLVKMGNWSEATDARSLEPRG